MKNEMSKNTLDSDDPIVKLVECRAREIGEFEEPEDYIYSPVPNPLLDPAVRMLMRPARHNANVLSRMELKGEVGPGIFENIITLVREKLALNPAREEDIDIKVPSTSLRERIAATFSFLF